MAEIELIAIDKVFRGQTTAALRDIHLVVPDGDFAAILGPSGCGKTTLLRIVAGLERPDAGEVRIGGRAVNGVPPARRDVAMVFQNYALYPHKKVFDNIALGLRLRGCPQARIREKADEVSRLLRISELMGRYPRQLSGGEQQRVALARALVREPAAFLLDEPLSNLDAQVREAMRSELKKIFREIRATVLFVTHDQTEAMMMADRLVVLDGGRVRQAGHPAEVYRDPAHRFVAEFIGTPPINTVPGRIIDGRFRSTDGGISLDAPVRGAGKALMAIRPEHLALGDRAEVRLAAETVLVEPTGPTNLLTVKAGGTELRMFTDRSPARGEALEVGFSPGHALFFDAASGLRLRPDLPG
jgi:multiple sugar transport system ATP-binding protein